MVHNDYLYNEFMENYNNKKTSFIRVAQNAVEGDLILNDILYYENTDKIYLVTDNTRDKFSANEDRTIEFREYEHTGEWEYICPVLRSGAVPATYISNKLNIVKFLPMQVKHIAYKNGENKIEMIFNPFDSIQIDKKNQYF